MNTVYTQKDCKDIAHYYNQLHPKSPDKRLVAVVAKLVFMAVQSEKLTILWKLVAEIGNTLTGDGYKYTPEGAKATIIEAFALWEELNYPAPQAYYNDYVVELFVRADSTQSITQLEYDLYINTGKVSSQSIALLARKVIDKTPLAALEQAIFAWCSGQINNLLRLTKFMWEVYQ